LLVGEGEDGDIHLSRNSSDENLTPAESLVNTMRSPAPPEGTWTFLGLRPAFKKGAIRLERSLDTAWIRHYDFERFL
jgi:hypothetical protein